MLRNLILAAALCLLPLAAVAQTVPSFAPGGTIALNTTAVSARVTLPVVASATTVIVVNLGTNTAFVALGDGTVTATIATGFPVLPQTSVALTLGTAVSAAAIGSDRTTLRFSVGQ